MVRRLQASLPLVALCLLAGTATPHGGQYRGGPGLPSPGGRGPATPSSPSPVTPPGPTTGGPGIAVPGNTGGAPAPDPTRWQIWWELNKDVYLRRRPGQAADDGDEPGTRVTDAQRRDVILPALRKAREVNDNRDLQTACMIAIAKIGMDHPDFEILPLLEKRLRRGDQEVRETAALSMGISENPEAVPNLIALLHKTTAGKRLMGREDVDDRTRAFAAYALGLIARSSDDAALKRQVFEALNTVLASNKEDNRDVLVAILNGMRQIGLDPDAGTKQKRLTWRTLEALRAYGEKDKKRTDQVVQAHVAPAIARILGRGAGPDRDRFKELWADALRSRKRVDATLRQSAGLGLGQVVEPAERRAEDAEYSKLLFKTFQRARDKQTQYFSLIALGQIGGDANLDRLTKAFKGSKGPTQAWAAIALGLLAHHDPAEGPQRRAVDTVGPLLTHGLRKGNPDVRAAVAIALGLARYDKAAPEMRKALQKYKGNELLGGHLCIGLALMDDVAAAPLIEQAMGDGRLRPYLVSQAALALARLQQRGAAAQLEAAMRQGSQGFLGTIRLAATSAALGHIGDAGSVDSLIRLLNDKRQPKLLRAFAAVSLGLIADDDELPWNAWIAKDINYRALVETLSNGSAGVLDIL